MSSAPKARPQLMILEGEALPPEDLAAEAEATSFVDALYRNQSRILLRNASRSGASRDEAQDLVQEAFLRVVRLKERALGLERPQAFLRRIASNLLKDRAREATRRPAELHIVADEEGIGAVDQLRLLESRDMLNHIEAAMMRLRPKTREIFMAHRIDGLSYAEIAARTGLSVKGVEKQMSKALQQLDRLLHR